MRAINHALTGAAIAIVVPSPAISLPLALMSHFALDALPHFDDDRINRRRSYFDAFLAVDALLCLLLVLVLFVFRPDAWLVPSVAAFAATSPDFMWIPYWMSGMKSKKQLKSWITRFHSKIQWSATPAGVSVEALWLAAFCYILLARI